MVGIIKLLGIGGNLNIHGHGSAISSSQGGISGLEVVKLFSCSTQLRTKFQRFIKTKMPTNEEVSCFKSLGVFIMLISVNCWHFNIYELDKFRAQLS